MLWGGKEIRAYLNKSNKNAGYAPMNAAKHQTGRLTAMGGLCHLCLR